MNDVPSTWKMKVRGALRKILGANGLTEPMDGDIFTISCNK